MDLMQRRSEAAALQTICELIGHEVTFVQATSAEDLTKTCKFIASIDSSHDKSRRKNVPLCVHLAAHGNEEGMAFGPEIITWHSLAKIIHPICADLDYYDGQVVVVISACGAHQQTLTKEFERTVGRPPWFVPPTYLFINADESPTFSETAVSWAVFYHLLPEVDLDKKDEVKEVLRKVREAGAATIKYYRWDRNRKKYLHHLPT